MSTRSTADVTAVVETLRAVPFLAPVTDDALRHHGEHGVELRIPLGGTFAVEGDERAWQGPEQDVDVHDGLDAPLTVLGERLGAGLEAVRDYGSDVPSIGARGGELNQVWLPTPSPPAATGVRRRLRWR